MVIYEVPVRILEEVCIRVLCVESKPYCWWAASRFARSVMTSVKSGGKLRLESAGRLNFSLQTQGGAIRGVQQRLRALASRARVEFRARIDGSLYRQEEGPARLHRLAYAVYRCGGGLDVGFLTLA
jgi:hypothetical protein